MAADPPPADVAGAVQAGLYDRNLAGAGLRAARHAVAAVYPADHRLWKRLCAVTQSDSGEPIAGRAAHRCDHRDLDRGVHRGRLLPAVDDPDHDAGRRERAISIPRAALRAIAAPVNELLRQD